MEGNADKYALIVLGGGFKKEGDTYSLPFWVEERVDRAREIYKKLRDKIDVIIFSTKYSYRFKDSPPPKTEAELMKEYALSIGLPEDKIVLEEDSLDTFSNAYFTRKIVDERGIKNIIVVTSDFHMHKAKMLFDFVYGDDYHIEYLGIRHKNVSEEELNKRLMWEREVMKEFKERIFPKLKKADMESIGNYILNESFPYTGKGGERLAKLRKERGEPPFY